MQDSLPVDEVEVAVQVARIHSAFAQLQLGLGVVVHVVHTHLFQDAKPSLWHRQEGDGSGPWLCPVGAAQGQGGQGGTDLTPLGAHSHGSIAKISV